MPMTAHGRAETSHRMDGVDQDAEGRAERRAHEQRRREDAAGRAGAEADGGGRELGGKQNNQQRRQVETAGEDRLNGRVADALHEIVAGADQECVDQHADDQHADEVAQIGIANAVKDVFGKAQAADEGGRGDPDQGAEQGVEQKRVERGRRLRGQQRARHGEGRMNAEEDPPDESGGAGGERDRQKGACAQFRHHQLDREHHAADRRIEGRGDAGTCAGGNERDALPRRHAHDLPERRADGRADLDDWALRPTAAPVPMDSAEASDLITATTGRIMPSL
jgi:hypothetical protein